MTELACRPIHLASDGSASIEPAMTGPEWFTAYEERYRTGIATAHLVTQYRFTESWSVWEVHPAGDEVVLCTEGALILIQLDQHGEEVRIPLSAGSYAINPSGVWHTADLAPGTSATCVFITSGKGTEHRLR